LIRFFIALGVAALVLVVAAYIMINQHFIEVLPSYFYQTLILLLFGTGLLYIYLYRFDRQDFFVHIYLLTMVVKLLAYGAYNFFVIMDDESGAVANVGWFMLLYMIFTLLEIVFLYRKISK
jgi:hypothetical protein